MLSHGAFPRQSCHSERSERIVNVSLDERIISQAIIERYCSRLTDCLQLDVAVVGAGPAGLVAAHHLARAGRTVALFERKLSLGGGMWGGGMMFNEIVIQEEARGLLESFGVTTRSFRDNYYTANSVETVGCLVARAAQAGVQMFNLVSVEDVALREERVTGLVINWTAVEQAGLHVDPLALHTRYVIDATGHAAEVARVIERKVDAKLLTPSGGVEGERSLWVERAEQTTLENTREVFPGVFVAGMSANATFGSYRMGPIFGGMLLSGQKAARLIADRLA
jgi:thiamine thiazole synthase